MVCEMHIVIRKTIEHIIVFFSIFPGRYIIFYAQPNNHATGFQRSEPQGAGALGPLPRPHRAHAMLALRAGAPDHVFRANMTKCYGCEYPINGIDGQNSLVRPF